MLKFTSSIKDKISFDAAMETIMGIDRGVLIEEGSKLKDYYFTSNSVELTNKLFNIV